MNVNRREKSFQSYSLMHVKDRKFLDKTTYISLFLLIFLTSSFVITNDVFSTPITILLWLFTFAVLLTGCSKLAISSNLLFVLLILLTCIWATDLYNGEKIINTCFLSFSLVVAFLFVLKTEFDNFKKKYQKIMVFLCIVSLVFTIIYLIFPSLKSFFVVRNNANASFSSLVLFVKAHGYDRNMGMFWEPGAFQSFILLAILFEITSERIDIKRFILYSVTIVSTFSTTGFIGLIFAIIYILISKKISRRMKLFIIAITVALAVFLLVFFFDTLFSTKTSSTIGKIINFYYHGGLSNDSANSVSVRLYSIIKPFESFLESPIFGWGINGLSNHVYEYTYGMNTCTFINWFAVYGLVFGLLLFVGYLRISKYLGGSIFKSLLVFIILFIITGSENYTANAFFILLGFYGYKKVFNPQFVQINKRYYVNNNIITSNKGIGVIQ